MSPKTHGELVNFIWGICNLLRGPYKRNEYRKVILPLTVLRRFDCVLAPTKERALARYRKIRRRSDRAIWADLRLITKSPVVNRSPFDFPKLLGDPERLAPNLNRYLAEFSRKEPRMKHLKTLLAVVLAVGFTLALTGEAVSQNLTGRIHAMTGLAHRGSPGDLDHHAPWSFVSRIQDDDLRAMAAAIVVAVENDR